MINRVKILPFDGRVRLFEDIGFGFEVFEKLNDEVDWQRDEVVMLGKHLTLRRLTAWYGDQPYAYTYSKISRSALPWSPQLSKIKTKAEELSSTSFNSCLLNFYHDGEDYMGWHSDDEPELDPHSPIASVSFGAERKFSFKHKQTKEVVDLMLPDRSLLLMEPPTQRFWYHTLRKSKKVKSARINLTFRNILI
jgi:alkylated DNA repair dioxygenase AlkB